MGVLRAAGRRDNAGFDIKGWLEANEEAVLGCLFTAVTNYGGPGIYIAMNRGHIVAWIDGIKHDSDGGLHRDMRPKWAWKVQRNHHKWEAPRAVRALLDD